MGRTKLGGTLLVAAALAFGLGMPGRAAAQADECLLQFQDAAGAIDDDAAACAETSGKVCTFELKLCVNQGATGCTPASLRKRNRASGHCGPVGKLSVLPSGDSPTCGNTATIKVRRKNNGQRDGRCVISASAKAGGGRKDLEKVVLVCKPTGGCPTPTTTTIQTTTTTSLAPTTTTIAATTTTTVGPTTTTIAVTTTTVAPTTTTIAVTTTTIAPVTTTTIGATTTTIIVPVTTTTTVGPTTTTIGTTTTTLAPTTTTIAVTTTTLATTTTTIATTTTTLEPTTTTIVTTTTTTTTTIPTCECCDNLPSLLSFTTGAPGGGSTGTVEPARCAQGTNNGTACATDATCTGGGVCRGHLDIGGLYFGSGQPAGINLPASIPDLSVSYTKIASCTGGNPVLTATIAADIPAGCSVPSGTPAEGLRHCTSAGCLFGSPLPIPNLANPPTSTCIVNEIATDASGTAVCATGATTLNLPLTSHVYLTGAVLGTQTCALCTGGTVGVCGSGTCTGGTRNGMACTPEGNALTSHDCPQPAGTFIGDLPIPFALSTGTQSKVSFATSALPRVFCGFCFDGNVTSAYANPPDPCVSDAECAARADNFDTCRQHNNGAFRNPFATTITETGSTAGECIGDGASHAATLVSVFCVPPSYDPIVDPSGELPGPGAVSLPGTAQLIP